MITGTGVTRGAVAIAALLGALATVTWRQSRALEALGALEDARRQSAVAEAERIELERSIRSLESRARVVSIARTRFGMRMPDASEQIMLARGVSP